MVTKFAAAAIAAMLALSVAPAHAGTIANGSWTPSGCGVEPTPPTIDTSSEKAFNASLDADEQFEKKYTDYANCAVKEANADQNAVAAGANTIQQDRQATVAKVKAAVDAGMDQYANKKKK